MSAHVTDAKIANEKVVADVTRWLNEVVIGLNLCPFSGKPTRENRVRFVVSSATDDEMLLQDLQQEMELLDQKPASEIETTLVIIPNHLQEFFDYNQFLNWADQLLNATAGLVFINLRLFIQITALLTPNQMMQKISPIAHPIQYCTLFAKPVWKKRWSILQMLKAYQRLIRRGLKV